MIRAAARAARRGSPDPELVERPKRRRFTAKYKLEILEQADACTRPGEVGELLRREGLYTSHLTYWRKQRSDGALQRARPVRAGASRPTGATPRSPSCAVAPSAPRPSSRRPSKVIEIQGNVSALLEQMLGTEGEQREHRAMIVRDGRGADAGHRHQAGVPGAGRVAGDDLPAPQPAGAAAAAAAAARRRGRSPTPSARRCWPSCTASGSSTARRRRSTRRCSTRAATCAPSARCTGSWPPSTARCASGATSSTHPAYAAPELLAERPNELWSWDITKLKGPAKWTYYYLYVILDVFSRYVVGWTVQHRETGPLAKALIDQAVEQQQHHAASS